MKLSYLEKNCSGHHHISELNIVIRLNIIILQTEHHNCHWWYSLLSLNVITLQTVYCHFSNIVVHQTKYYSSSGRVYHKFGWYRTSKYVTSSVRVLKFVFMHRHFTGNLCNVCTLVCNYYLSDVDNCRHHAMITPFFSIGTQCGPELKK